MVNVLAIVGSTRFGSDTHATEVARVLILSFLSTLEPKLVISGGAIGIDKLSVNIAEQIGIKTEEYKPRLLRWEPDGYRDRNIKIAEACDVLMSIRHFESTTYGSGWTADYAESKHKKVLRFMYQPNYEIEKL